MEELLIDPFMKESCLKFYDLIKNDLTGIIGDIYVSGKVHIAIGNDPESPCIKYLQIIKYEIGKQITQYFFDPQEFVEFFKKQK